MNLTLEIPDDLVGLLSAVGGICRAGHWRCSLWRNTRGAMSRRRSCAGCWDSVPGMNWGGLKAHEVWAPRDPGP
jgi:hypothetical protein